MKVHQQIAQVIAEARLTHAFGVMGSGNMLMISDLVDRFGLRYVAACREDGAIMMADAYARATGTVGLATVTYGPSFANVTHALIESTRSRTPMVVLTGDTPSTVLHHMQDFDHAAATAVTGAGFHRVRFAGSASEDTRLAVRMARAQRRPIVLDVPVDLQEETATEDSVTTQEDPTSRPFPDPSAIDRALGIMTTARRPLLLAGRGAVESQARPVLLALADALGAATATTAKAKDMFRGHPLNLGVCGSLSYPLAQEAIAACDVAVVFGASLSEHTRQALPKAPIIRVDLEPAAFGGGIEVTLDMRGDAAAVAATMTDWLTEAGIVAGDGWSDFAVKLAERMPSDDFTEQSTATTIDARAACITLNDILPAPRSLVVDGGHFMTAPMCYLDVDDPRDFVFAVTFGSVGLGLGAAVGVAVARPEVTTVLAVGDGGWMMSLAEFATAAREKLDLIVVVFNDGAYGQEWHHFRQRDVSTRLAFIGRPDLGATATALGGTSVRLRTRDDLADVEKAIRERDRPLLVDVQIDPGVRFGVGD